MTLLRAPCVRLSLSLSLTPSMDSFYTLALPFLFLFILCSPYLSSSQLSPSFYALSCPNVELLVRDSVRSASNADPSLLGKLLRLLFHDCIVEFLPVSLQGCDASVLVAGNGTERSDPANLSLGGFEAVDAAKKLVDLFCPGIVSCADVLVLAARDAVAIAGGPSVEVPLGRRDGRVSLASNVRPNMVDTSFSLDEMAHLFSAKGLSMEDLIALSGAHTIGSAHCSAFSERFKEDANGNLVPIDGSIEENYAMELIKSVRLMQARRPQLRMIQ
ncbi:hypothetical protein HPP92_010251 [Vanilla planifolia]|uniref:peroxidase n=1 Tax=Vanilla planifolia TaxID=51239 RepID=A0A835V1N0_VANPL|nr:hypothetical protein HPP92_010251 [Vanilla planifolia]